MDDYQRFAALEYKAMPDLRGLRPGAAWDRQDQEITKAEKAGNRVTVLAAAWRTLAEAKAAGLEMTERLRLVEAEGRPVLRITWRAGIKHDQPMLVLDADADAAILAAIGLEVHGDHDLSMRPNAHVRQLLDRRMTTSRLLQSPDLRESWRRIIVREVFEDRLTGGGGVLVGASRKVVRAMFKDADHSFSEMSEDQISQVMLGTHLHGARWLWFGGGSLGSNRYETCTRVIVIGREELPIDILEDQGRALFGDVPGNPLTFAAQDSTGRTLLPQREVPYLMADGSAKAVNVPCHPDPRIHLLQQQSRELATRQLIERLRLARAKSPKHVLIGCNIPIPGMPVDRLVSWEELCPDRLTAALIDGLTYKGGVRLTPAGLHEGSPRVFSSLEAARVFLKRRTLNRSEAAKSFADRFSSRDILSMRIRNSQPMARTETALMLRSLADPIQSVAHRLWGPCQFV
ncbi:hypothetical protein [Paracoccus actinidiae]|uniref:hypothetical protein n=1 Tax=Paracoccus actinidiae TaxID=3064531 RepID=UPI0027D23E8A|nr:hypothetical protein [Paracoccus sp. M09]